MERKGSLRGERGGDERGLLREGGEVFRKRETLECSRVVAGGGSDVSHWPAVYRQHATFDI